MYPSDYGYSADMSSCSDITLNSYSDSCYSTSWIYNSSYSQWTISPAYNTYRSMIVFRVDIYKYISAIQASYANGVRPVVYLSPDIKIVGGIGTDTQPYILSK